MYRYSQEVSRKHGRRKVSQRASRYPLGLCHHAIGDELDKLCMTSGPKAAAALIHEAQLLAKLSHPNIITVYETGRHGDDVFFVMEFIRARRTPAMS